MDEERLLTYGHPLRYTHAKCNAATAYTCAKARHLDNKIVLLADRTEFPLAGCNADWCACGWRYLMPREMGR